MPHDQGADLHDECPVRISLIGPVHVRVDRRTRPVGGPQAQAVLAALALRAPRTVTIEELAAITWEDEPRTAATTLSTVVSRLRKVVDPATIERRAGAYALRIPADAVDVTRFSRTSEHALEVLRHGDAQAALALIDRALGIWRGEPLEGLPARGVVPAVRQRLWAKRTDLRIARGQALIAVGRAVEAVDHLHDVVRTAPEREHAWLLLARTLYATGRQQEALEVLRTARAGIRDAAGLDPGPALDELERQVLTHTVAPGWSTAGAARGATAAATGFHGRAVELQAVQQALHRRQDVLVLGPPGAGKSRLVAEALARADVRRPVRWLDVRTHASGPDDLRAAVLAALEVPHGTSVPSDEALRPWLAGRSAVLVLDGAEHLAEQVQRICQVVTGAGTSVVVTSRDRLQLPAGAAVVDVGPLPVTAADGGPGPGVDLLRDRAATAARVRPGDLDPGTATRLCELVDGLPLGIEVVAGLLRAFDPGSLVDFLQQDRGLAVRDLGGDGARLHLALQDSWVALGDAERTVLRCAARFQADVDLPALAGVVQALPAGSAAIGGATALPVAVQGLVGRSLLQVGEAPAGGRTYRLLDTVRAFAADQRPEGEEEAVELAHARWMAAEARSIGAALLRPGHDAELDRLAARLADAGAAIGWARTRQPDLAMAVVGGLAWGMFVRTRLTTLERWVDQLTAAVDEADLTAGACMAASLVGYARGRSDDTRRLAVAAAARADGVVEQVMTRFWVAWAESIGEGGQPDVEAMAAVQRDAARDGVEVVAAYAETAIAWQLLALGRVEDALAQADRGMASAERIQQAWAVGFNRFLHGLAAVALGRLDVAARSQRQALHASLACGHTTGLAELLAGLAMIGLSAGRAGDAARILGALDVLVPATGMDGAALPTYTALGQAVDRDAQAGLLAEGRVLPLDRVIALASGIAPD